MLGLAGALDFGYFSEARWELLSLSSLNVTFCDPKCPRP